MILPLSAIAMLIFGSVVLYGGLVYFLYRALKENKKKMNRSRFFFD